MKMSKETGNPSQQPVAYIRYIKIVFNVIGYKITVIVVHESIRDLTVT